MISEQLFNCCCICSKSQVGQWLGGSRACTNIEIVPCSRDFGVVNFLSMTTDYTCRWGWQLVMKIKWAVADFYIMSLLLTTWLELVKKMDNCYSLGTRSDLRVAASLFIGVSFQSLSFVRSLVLLEYLYDLGVSPMQSKQTEKLTKEQALEWFRRSWSPAKWSKTMAINFEIRGEKGFGSGCHVLFLHLVELHYY